MEVQRFFVAVLIRKFYCQAVLIPKPEWFGTISAQLVWFLMRQKT